MKVLVVRSLRIICLIICMSCRQQQPVATDVPEALVAKPLSLAIPSTWIKLTEHGGKSVIFYPCDADNIRVELRPDTLIIGWGQDAEQFFIESIDRVEVNQLSIKARSEYEDEPHEFTVELLDDKNSQARWHIWDDASSSELFTEEKVAVQYKEVKQPCRECWEDEQCDEMEEGNREDK
jgi:hypothetical protein